MNTQEKQEAIEKITSLLDSKEWQNRQLGIR